jgi:OOP family OmpA-OmpF porin
VPKVGYNDLGNIHAKNIFNSQPVVEGGKSSCMAGPPA